MLRLFSTVTALLVAGAVYFYLNLMQKRKEIEGLPQPPMPNKILGHLKLAGELQTVFPPNTHGHTWASYLRKKHNLGDFFYFDLWPIGPRFLFMADPELASQYVTTTQSLPKSSLETSYINAFLGDKNMVSVEGSEWKAVRSIFNPGFAASHLMTLAPYIVNASLEFCAVMRRKARTNELFELEEYTTRLTIDIIGKVVLDVDFNAQSSTHPIVETFRQRVGMMSNSSSPLPWDDFDALRPLKLWWNARKLDRLIGDELDGKLARRVAEQEDRGEKKAKERKRSVIDLALDAYQKEMVQNESEKGQSASADHVHGTFRKRAIDSIKSFIFAGHDTTSSTIAYAFYLLHLHPNVHKKCVTELDTVFGTASSSTTTMAELIKAEPHIINRLEYVTAVIKEVLRVFPPASTLRYTPTSTDPSKNFFVDPKSGTRFPLAGWHIWPTVHTVGRNDAFYPRPAEFIPERFIPSLTPFPGAKLFTAAGKDAWRPFEKGPRNCIGQELAMIETKIILALIIKEFDFVAEYDGVKLETWKPVETAEEFADGMPGNVKMTVEGHRCYQILKGSAKPVDGMPGRMYLR